MIYGGGLIRRNIGQVTAVGGRALRTPQGHPIRYVDDDIVIDLPDGRQAIYCGHEGRAEAIRNGALTRTHVLVGGRIKRDAALTMIDTSATKA